MIKTIVVWVLVAYTDGYNAGGPLVVDNIATKAECERLAARIKYLGDETEAVCTQVQKVAVLGR